MTDSQATFGAAVLGIPGWITHVYTTAMAGDWVWCVVGALLIPLGVISGWWVWIQALLARI